MDTRAALQVYKDLADWYERQGQAAMRDRFLILAAEAAFSSGHSEEAERLRQQLLQGNPHHMLKPFRSFAQARQSTNVQIYIHDLQVNYPPETAEELLRDLRNGASPAPPIREEKTLPQSQSQLQPVSTRREEPPQSPASTTEPLKTYPLRETPPVKPTPSHRSVSPPLLSSSGKEGKGRPLPRSRSQPMPPPPLAAVSPPSETTPPAGAWLSLLLLGMTVTAAIALAFYTLARPFLPGP